VAGREPSCRPQTRDRGGAGEEDEIGIAAHPVRRAREECRHSQPAEVQAGASTLPVAAAAVAEPSSLSNAAGE
jgi:hypothetical protein